MIQRDKLCRRWLHSYEEDDPKTLVYRPDDFKLPPARGRDGFEFRADQSCLGIGIGATDVPVEYQARWEFHDDGSITIYEASTPVKVIRVVGEDRLEIDIGT